MLRYHCYNLDMRGNLEKFTAPALVVPKQGIDPVHLATAARVLLLLLAGGGMESIETTIASLWTILIVTSIEQNDAIIVSVIKQQMLHKIIESNSYNFCNLLTCLI